VNKSQNLICSSYKVIVSCHKIGTQTTQFIWISFTISLCTFWSVKVLWLGLSKNSGFIKNIFICVLKMNKSLTGLEWCEGKWLFIFGEQCFNQFFKKCLTQTFFFFCQYIGFSSSLAIYCFSIRLTSQIFSVYYF